jgi:hypothetical protein
MKLWSISLTALALMACDKDKDPPVDTDPPDPVEETALPEETAEEETEPPVPDTGLTFVLTIEGEADVSPGVFLGHEAQVWRFVSPEGTLSKPRCVYAWDAINWELAPSRLGRADPLALRHDRETYCPDCIFSFTVSMEARERRFDLPWDTDTDAAEPADTDAADTDAPVGLPGGFKDEDPTTAPFDCYTLDAVGAGQLLLEDQRWIGYGFDPLLGNDDDPNTGTLMFWDTLNNQWVPYLYDMPFIDGHLSWFQVVQGYQLNY